MALCVQTEIVYVPVTNASTPRVQMDVIRQDWAGSQDNCAGWLLLTKSELDGLKASNAIPASEDLAQVFQVAFVLVLGSYVVAYLLGRLIASFNTRGD